MEIAVIGGGVNGVMSAWALSRRQHRVHLYEKGELMGATSSASTKLIHGGLRYLEHGEFRLVREALRERRFWISAAPHLVHRLELILPVYRSSRRPRWMMHAGLLLYDLLAGADKLGRYRWLNLPEIMSRCPELNPQGLLGAFTFFDAQMDDHALGLWASDQAQLAGVTLNAGVEATSITADGTVHVSGEALRYDFVINATGPWAAALLAQSGVPSAHHLDLVRGSHLVLNRPLENAFLVEVPDEERFCFILPYQGRTLLGTTEIRQPLDEPIACSQAEQLYLLDVYNHYIHPSATEQDVVGRFAGLRPLIRSHVNQSRATREYALETHGRILTVFGGKWTTAHALGEKVASSVEAALREVRG